LRAIPLLSREPSRRILSYSLNLNHPYVETRLLARHLLSSGCALSLTLSVCPVAPTGIFGVPLSTSIKYANVAISLTDPDGKQFTYGYVPIVVAKCGVFLKEKGEYLRLQKH